MLEEWSIKKSGWSAFQILKKNNNINLILIGDEVKETKHYIKNTNLTKCSNNFRYNKYNAISQKSKFIYLCFTLRRFSNVLMRITVNLQLSTYFKSGLSELLLNGKGGTIIKNSSPESIVKKIKSFFDNKKLFKKKAEEAKRKITELNYFQGQLKFKKLINSL